MKGKWIILAALAGVACGAVSTTLRKKKTSPVWLGRGRDWPAGFAHRGASALAPENTVEAFRQAVEAGAGALELDVHMTRDGEIVVIHDPTVDRTTDGSGLVGALLLSDIRKLDAGYRFSPDGTSYPYRGRGLTIPTLAEVFREFPEAVMNFEIKERQAGIEEAVLREVSASGAGGRVLVAAEKHDVMRRFRKVSGGKIPTAASRFEIGVFYFLSRLRLAWLSRPAYDALQVPVSHKGMEIATRRFMDAAHSLGVRVDVWTIDDPAEMRRLLDLGADGIMSNRPDLLARVLGERWDQAATTSAAEITPNSA